MFFKDFQVPWNASIFSRCLNYFRNVFWWIWCKVTHDVVRRSPHWRCQYQCATSKDKKIPWRRWMYNWLLMQNCILAKETAKLVEYISHYRLNSINSNLYSIIALAVLSLPDIQGKKKENADPCLTPSSSKNFVLIRTRHCNAFEWWTA